MQASYALVPMGRVQSDLKALDDAPNQREGASRAWIVFDEQVAEGARDLPRSAVVRSRCGQVWWSAISYGHPEVMESPSAPS